MPKTLGRFLFEDGLTGRTDVHAQTNGIRGAHMMKNHFSFRTTKDKLDGPITGISLCNGTVKGYEIARIDSKSSGNCINFQANAKELKPAKKARTKRNSESPDGDKTSRKKRSHSEFLDGLVEKEEALGSKMHYSQSSTPTTEICLTQQLSKRKLKKLKKQEAWIARIAELEATKKANGDAPFQKPEKAVSRDVENERKKGVDQKQTTEEERIVTKPAVDPEIEFLKNKKQKQRERELGKFNTDNYLNSKDSRLEPGIYHRRQRGNSTLVDEEDPDLFRKGLVMPWNKVSLKSTHKELSNSGITNDPPMQLIPTSSTVFTDKANRSLGCEQHSMDSASFFLQHRMNLPIWEYQDLLRQALQERNILVLLGETGSGKSTQLVQFLVKEPWMKPQKLGSRTSEYFGSCIVVTQPRRLAATSLARRVAQEMGVRLGEEVGYNVRFDNRSKPHKTKIKFVTDGMLLREMLEDPELKRYCCVIVDEAHERSVQGDLVLGFLKGLVKKGGKRAKGKPNPLKVVVMSATIETRRFGEFFYERMETAPSGVQPIANGHKSNSNSESYGSDDEADYDSTGELSNVGICRIKGRQYPVDIFYSAQPFEDYCDAALRTVFQIHYKEPLPGDILVFLTGQEEVEALERKILDYATQMDASKVPKLMVLPLYAQLQPHLQNKIFELAPYLTRRVILATNIAETSVTVPGVRYVVDTGMAKTRQYRPRLGLESLLVAPISQSSAQQRAGRAGREAAGKCYRLCTEEAYSKLPQQTVPEILQVDVAGPILSLYGNGCSDVFTFDYLDAPNWDSLRTAHENLLTLGALEASAGRPSLTQLGREMAKLPVSPNLSRVLIAARQPEFDCLGEVIDIISVLSSDCPIMLQPSQHSLELDDEKKEKFENARKWIERREGDHITILNVTRAFFAEQDDRKRWCEEHFISHRAMKNVLDVRKQLRAYFFPKKEEPNQNSFSGATISPELAERILKCFLTGYFRNTAKLCPDGKYRSICESGSAAGGIEVAIHPTSVLFGRSREHKLEAIMYHEVQFTSKTWARWVSSVEVSWVCEILRF